MKRIVPLALLGAVLLLLACAHSYKYKNEAAFKGKTGVVGVFRQAAFYCSEATPHYAKIGDSTIVVKPTWSEEQDNFFFAELKSGPATLYSYSYNCGENENKFVLDTTSENKGPSGVVIPESGLCKIVISFVQGDRLFDHNDALIEEEFKKAEIALDPSKIPYCEVLKTDGSKVSFANRDSLLAENYKAAVEAAKNGSCEDIRPLVSLDTNSDKVTWNAEKDKALMIAVHSTPDLFENGAPYTVTKDMRVFSDKEFLEWYKMNSKGCAQLAASPAPTARAPARGEHYALHHVLGFPEGHDPPGVYPDVTSSEMTCRFNEEDDSQLDSLGMWLRNWFDNTWSASYKSEGGYPWTRLGYTYDWGSSGDKYGLSEFLVREESQVTVQTTKDLKAFVRWMGDRR